MARNRFWAVGFKDWVEIRSLPKPPKALKTEVDRVYKSHYDVLINWDDDTHQPIYKKSTMARKLKIKVTHFEGGKVLATIPAREFEDITLVGVQHGEMLELKEETVKRLLKITGELP